MASEHHTLVSPVKKDLLSCKFWIMDDTFEEDGETLSDGICGLFSNTLHIFHNEILKLEKPNFIHTCLNCSQSD